MKVRLPAIVPPNPCEVNHHLCTLNCLPDLLTGHNAHRGPEAAIVSKAHFIDVEIGPEAFFGYHNSLSNNDAVNRQNGSAAVDITLAYPTMRL